MTDTTDRTKAADRSEFPPFYFPTIFVDGVMSMANSTAVVKYYLGRNDPSFQATGISQLQPIAQVVMPMAGSTDRRSA